MKIKNEKLYLVYFLIFIASLHQIYCEKSIELEVLKNNFKKNMNSNNKERIRIPDASDQMPNHIKLMQSYGLAIHDKSPRFIQQNQNAIRLPNRINRSLLDGEQIINILSAFSNSIYKVKFLFFLKEYPAINAIRDMGSYWCSTGSHEIDEEVIYEVTFHKIERVHGMNMIFAYAPGKYKVEYTIDEIKYETILNYHNTIEEANRTWWVKLIPTLKQSFKSFPDRVTFDNPVFAKKIRIVMKDPVNFYFGLYKLEFFTKEWVIMIKSAQSRSCHSEQCWSVNQINPTAGVKLEIADCIKTLALSENRELFKFTVDGLLQHFETGLCVTSAQDKELKLMNCNEALEKNDGREKFIFEADGSVLSEYNQDECISAATEIINYALFGIAEASSVLDNGNHEPYRAIDNNPATFWASSPGTTYSTFTLNFSNWITIDRLIIHWKYKAKDFDVYALTFEKGWKHIVKINNNCIFNLIIDKTSQKINLNRINIKTIQIQMTKAAEKFLDLPIFGILNIHMTSGGKNLSRNTCLNLSKDEKKFIFEEQYFYQTNQKINYIKEMNSLAKYNLMFGNIKKKLVMLWDQIKQAKKTSNKIKKLIDETKISTKTVFERLKVFKSQDMKKKNFNYLSIIKKYKMESFFDKPKKNISLGSFSTNPAVDCYQIIKINRFKKSGFYWIKPSCSKFPIKVFCDFSIQTGGVSIYIHNNDQLPNSILESFSIHSYNDIRFYCAKKGLYPIEIQNKDYITRLHNLLKFLGWDLSNSNVIPLAFDYNCEKGSCIYSYKSLNSLDSKNILPLFQENDSESAVISSFRQKNTVGFGYSANKKPFFFDIIDANYTALICSTNEYGLVNSDPSVIELACKDNLVNKRIGDQIGITLKVRCPEYCDLDTSNIYGDNKYSMNSSICKAAIHSGVLNSVLGGEFKINIAGYQNDFTGSLKFNIKSKETKMQSSKTFIPMKAEQKCPIDFIKSYLGTKHSSFIESHINSMLENNSKFLSEQELLDLISNHKNDNNPKEDFYRLIEIDVKDSKTSVNNNTNTNISSTNNTNQTLNNTINKIENNNNTSNYTNITNIINNKTDVIIKELEEPQNLPCNNINTDKAILEIEEIRKIDTADLKSLQIFGKKIEKFTKKFNNQIAWSRDSNSLSTKTLSNRVKQLKLYISKLNLYGKKVSKDGYSRLKLSKYQYSILKEKYLLLERTQGYKMNYKNLGDYWTCFNNKNTKDYPSDWKITERNLLGRKNAILQSSKIKSKNHRIASFYYMKNKNLYDFKYYVDILSNSGKSAGVIFRMKDPYNFYAFEFNQKKGYKKLFKSINGNYKQIAILKDGGLSQNQWYKILIIAVKQKITIKMGIDDGKNLSLPIIFKVEDDSLISGSMGLFVNGNDKFYFDNINLKPISCWKPWKPSKKLKVISERSNIYEENFKQDIFTKYEIIDPQNQERGPSIWKFTKQKFGADDIIYQYSDIIDQSPYSEPSHLILKDNFLKKGFLYCDFIGIKKGVIGVVFRYIDKNNYYIFEIGVGDKSNGFFQIRKKSQGIMTTIRRINPEQIKEKGLINFVFRGYKWLRVKIMSNNNNFNIFLSIPGKQEQLIFSFEEKEFDYGRIGFSTFGTPAAFTNIVLRPAVEATSISLFERDLQKINTENDVFVYQLSKKNKISKKIPIKDNDRINTYRNCLKNKTNDQRILFCKTSYANNPILRISCERSYCNTCCEKTVSRIDKISLYHCKKLCGSIKIDYNQREETQMYENLCIEPKNPDVSLYSHCDDNFEGLIQKQNCKIDACRICCISIDPIYHANQSEESLNDCWKKCSTSKINHKI